jgi:putative addiction module component (TIGR02574 family)
MAIRLEDLGLDRLSLEEKLELVGRLWDEIVASVPPGELLSDAQREELRRRVAEAQAHPEDYVAWEDALAATLKRLVP